MRKLFVFLCIAVCLLTVGSFSVNAASSGTLENCEWSLDGTVLTISGNGAMPYIPDDKPWGDAVTEVIINEGVTSVGICAFNNCKTLEKVTLPSTLKVIEGYAFANCQALFEVNLPSGVTTIDYNAFQGCASLVEFTIPASVTYIGRTPFSQCHFLNNILVEKGNTSFVSVDGVLFSKDMSVLYRYPADKRGTEYTVPRSVKEIADGAFEYSNYLREITLHDGITEIGSGAFFASKPYYNKDNIVDGCIYLGNHLIGVNDTDMTSCTVRKGTKVIADSAFGMTNKLINLELPEGVTHIGNNAFSWNWSLSSVSIPNSILKIEDDAFYDCNAIKHVFFSGSRADKEKIEIGLHNEKLTDASWDYNVCFGGDEHTLDKAVVTKEATCSSSGEKQSVCLVCSAVITEKLDVTDHSYSQWSQTQAPTCVSTGEEERICTLCGNTETRVLDVMGHVYGPWSVEIDATCDEVGVQKRVCAVCQNIDAVNIEPKGHTFGESKTVKRPKTDETGLAEAVCAVCGDVSQTVLAMKEKGNNEHLIIIGVAVIAVAAVGIVAAAVLPKKKKD